MRAASALAAILALLLSLPAWGYDFMSCGGRECDWASYPVSYWISSAGTPDTEGENSAIKNAFTRWEAGRQTFCEIDFTYAGTSDLARFSGSDRRNLVFWVEDGWDYGEDALAVTLCTYYVDSGKLLDCDVGLNGQDFTWTAQAGGSGQNIRDVLSHEIGHFWGLDHSGLQTATMYAYYQSRYLISDLDEDDIAGACARYCGAELAADDELEPDDSLLTAARIQVDQVYDDLRLYDHDTYKITIQGDERLGVLIEDQDAQRVKGVKLYDGNRNLLDERTCVGSCSAYFGELGGATTALLKIYAAFDQSGISDAQYSFELRSAADPAQDSAAPGAPDDVEDGGTGADDDDDDDSGGGESGGNSGCCGQ